MMKNIGEGYRPLTAETNLGADTPIRREIELRASYGWDVAIAAATIGLLLARALCYFRLRFLLLLSESV